LFLITKFIADLFSSFWIEPYPNVDFRCNANGKSLLLKTILNLGVFLLNKSGTIKVPSDSNKPDK
jgi:hypothetical protein